MSSKTHPIASNSGFHARLLVETSVARDALLAESILHEAIAGRVTRAEYAQFLTQAYHHVRHTTPLLMSCGGRLPARLEWLRDAIAAYIAEELGHQQWILDDLRAMGCDAEAAANATPAPATELMIAYAYDTIARGNPVGFFGMVLVLEGTSVALATRAADTIEASLGLPRSAFSYLRSHGDLDIEHTGFYARLMDQLDDPQDQQAVIHAARMFYRLYGGVFASLRPASAPLAVAA